VTRGRRVSPGRGADTLQSLLSWLKSSRHLQRLYRFIGRSLSGIHRRIPHRDRLEEYERVSDGPGTDFDHPPEVPLFQEGVQIRPHPDVVNPVLEKDDIHDALAAFVADPFIVYADGLYNMFFEIKDLGGTLFIGHAFSEQGYDWQYNSIVLGPETAQHSFPHVFRYDNDWLMIPSPGPDVRGELRIYRAVEFPTGWELLSTPIRTGVRVDPTPIYSDGRWYLIYQNTDSMNVELRHAHSLTASRWQAHPASPLFRTDQDQLQASVVGQSEMVPSGRPLPRPDGIDIFYRSSVQQQVYQYRITDLTPESFEQHRVQESPVFGGVDPTGWNDGFMHTLNPVYPWHCTNDIIAVDGQGDRGRYSIGIFEPVPSTDQSGSGG